MAEGKKDASREFGMIAHTELVSTDHQATRDFLAKVFHWNFETMKAPTGDLLSFHMSGGARGSIRQTRRDEIPSSINYVLVDDLDSAADEIKRFGGEIILPRVDVPQMGSFFWFKVPGGLFSLAGKMRLSDEVMMPVPEWKMVPPKDDDEYFERMNRAIFQAGLNWKMIENKWKNFQEAFSSFSVEKVAKFSERDVKTLMRDEGIVRNERKIRAAIFSAGASLKLEEEFGSFKKYFASFEGDDDRLLADLRGRFHNLGPSSARVFLMMSGLKLKPTPEELEWHAKVSTKKKMP